MITGPPPKFHETRDNLPRSRPEHQARYPASYPVMAPGGAAIVRWFPVGLRPPTFASWTSCSRQRIPLTSRSAHRPSARTGPGLSRGFPCSARMRCDRVGCLLYPTAVVSSRTAQPLRSAPAACQRPALYPGLLSRRRRHINRGWYGIGHRCGRRRQAAPATSARAWRRPA